MNQPRPILTKRFSDALEFQAGYDGTHGDSDPLHGADPGDHVGLEGLLADVVADHQTTDAHAFGDFEDGHEFAAPDDNSEFDDDLDPDP